MTSLIRLVKVYILGYWKVTSEEKYNLEMHFGDILSYWEKMLHTLVRGNQARAVVHVFKISTCSFHHDHFSMKDLVCEPHFNLSLTLLNTFLSLHWCLETKRETIWSSSCFYWVANVPPAGLSVYRCCLSLIHHRDLRAGLKMGPRSL